ncbi:hypothetical protein ACVWXQ_006018 [Bradyrhizobium sp. S3.14.4]
MTSLVGGIAAALDQIVDQVLEMLSNAVAARHGTAPLSSNDIY